MFANNQFSKIEFIHQGEELTEVQHGSIPTVGETIQVCGDDGTTILRGEVDDIHRNYEKYDINESTGSHDVNLIVEIQLRKVYEYKEDHYAT